MTQQDGKLSQEVVNYIEPLVTETIESCPDFDVMSLAFILAGELEEQTLIETSDEVVINLLVDYICDRLS